MGMLKLAFNVSSDDQGNHPDDLSITVNDLFIACEVTQKDMDKYGIHQTKPKMQPHRAM